jgi:alkylated DNA repair dioxygenase AlkB
MSAPELLLDDPSRGCRVTYDPAFLSGAEADALFALLQASAPFAAESPVIFGKAHRVARQSCAFGDAGVSYRYAGVLRETAPWPEALLALRARLFALLAARFNFVLCNLYPDGQAGLGWHSDDERDLAPGAPIASLSLGAARDFYLRRGFGDRAVVVKRALAHGSLLVMAGQTQRFYQHQVPKRARCDTPRINLTFRVMLQRQGMGDGE